MAIYAAPGATFEAALDATTGLTPTVAIYNTPAGTTIYGPSSSGVTEFPAGSGLYAVSLTAPSTQGGYSVVWAFGGQYAREDLVITADGAPTPSTTPSGSDLTTLEMVKLYLGIGNTDHDVILASLITRASVALMHYAGREFAPASTATTRDFYYDGSGLLDLSPYDLRTVTSITYDPSGDNTTLVVDDDYTLGRSTSDAVYNAVTITGYSTAATVQIEGDWGFASVPVDVEHACILTVATWRSQIGGAFKSSFFADPEGIPNDQPQAYAGGIPAAARRLLEPYMRMYVG